MIVIHHQYSEQIIAIPYIIIILLFNTNWFTFSSIFSCLIKYKWIRYVFNPQYYYGLNIQILSEGANMLFHAYKP